MPKLSDEDRTAIIRGTLMGLVQERKAKCIELYRGYLDNLIVVRNVQALVKDMDTIPGYEPTQSEVMDAQSRDKFKKTDHVSIKAKVNAMVKEQENWVEDTLEDMA